MRLRDSPVIVNSITERAEKQNTELVIAEQTSSHTKHRGCSNTVGIISITLGTLMRTVSERRGGSFLHVVQTAALSKEICQSFASFQCSLILTYI